jgi:hypothetical protein
VRLAWLALLSACTTMPEPPRAAKPHAPVSVTVVATELGRGLHEVRLEARALVALEDLELELVLPPGAVLRGGQARARLGPLPSGASRHLRARVAATSPAEVVGTARTPGGGQAAAVALGGPARRAAPLPAARVVLTPFGPVAVASEVDP